MWLAFYMYIVLLAKTTTTMLKRPGVGVVLVVILTVAMTNTKITFQRLSGLESTLKNPMKQFSSIRVSLL